MSSLPNGDPNPKKMGSGNSFHPISDVEKFTEFNGEIIIFKSDQKWQRYRQKTRCKGRSRQTENWNAPIPVIYNRSREKFRKFLTWAEPQLKGQFFWYPSHNIQEKVLMQTNSTDGSIRRKVCLIGVLNYQMSITQNGGIQTNETFRAP